MQNNSSILSVGTAVPTKAWSQADIVKRLNITKPSQLRFFNHNHINNRFLGLPAQDLPETTGDLLIRFENQVRALSCESFEKACKAINLSSDKIDFLCVVSSTGLIVPSISARLVGDLKLRSNIQRTDIVGMGCNAGLNGLQVVRNWTLANPGKFGALVCSEICSAIYDEENTNNSAIVNSLFADGSAAVVLSTIKPSNVDKKFEILAFESTLIKDSLPDLRFDWNREKSKYSFFIDKATPKKLGNSIRELVENFLKEQNLKMTDINQWILHTGGSAILDEIQGKLELKKHSLIHTRDILKNYGNLSSASFLFTYKNILSHEPLANGALAIMITMGPGLSIEMALGRWNI
ncbi:MAG: type III polyketide synthase [Bdellovibrionales bacterium]|nr:type III polyketide synthase [Bdellovibrionales bacterium]